MRICLLTHTLRPQTGAGIFAKGIVDGVQHDASDIEFTVLTSENYVEPNVYKILKNWFYIRNEFKHADAIHAVDAYPYGLVACLANITISKPIIITAVGTGSVRKLNGKGLRSLLLRWVYGRATIITAISNYVASEIQKVLPHLSVKVIGPDVDYKFYAQSINASDETGTKYEYIISQGELKRRKGYSEILPIMKRVMDLRPSIRYVIIANASRNLTYREELYELMDKLGIINKIIIKSDLSREELREAYAKAILYLAMPKNNNGDIEGFGMAIMEASATGTPAVVGKGSGADDAILDGKSGFLVDGENENEVVEKVLSIVDNKDLREKLSKGARKWAETYSLDNKPQKYLSIYDKYDNLTHL